MQINLVFDASFANAPAGEKAAIQAAAAILDNLITDNISVTIDVGLDEADGVALSFGTAGLSVPVALQSYSYAQVQAALTAHASSPLAQQIAASLPSAAAAGSSIELLPAQAYALGLATPSAGAVDGYVGFGGALAVDAQLTLYLHELTHALGRHRADTLMSLYSYSAPGVLAGDNSSNAYFSIDGGVTSLGQLDPSDPGDFLSSSSNNVNYTSGSTNIDLLTALGFTVNPAPAATAQIAFQNWSGTSFSDRIGADIFHSSQAMTYSATLADGSPLPSWVTFDPTTLTFSGSLPSSVTAASIKLTATNSLGSASEIFDVGMPLHTVSDQSIKENVQAGQPFSINLNALFTGPVTSQATQFSLFLAKQDGQGDQIWSGSGIPSWLSIDPVTHILSGTMPTAASVYHLFVGAWNADGNVSLGGIGSAANSYGMSSVELDLSTASPPVSVKPEVSVSVAWGQNFTIQLPNPVFTDASATITSVTFNGQDALANNQSTSPPPLPWTSYDPTSATITGTAPTSGSNIYHLALVAEDSNNSSGGEDIFVFLGNSITVDELYEFHSFATIPVHTVADSWANLTSESDIINQFAASSGITNIQVTDTSPIILSTADLQTDASLLAMVSSSRSFAIQDNSAQIVNSLATLESMAVAGTLSSIAFTDGGRPTLTLTAQQQTDDAAALALITTPYTLITASSSVASALSSSAHVAMAISDSAYNVQANLDALESLAKAGGISAISFTDGSAPTFNLTAGQIGADMLVLEKVTSPYTLVVSGGGTLSAGIAADLVSHIQGHVAISDSAANVVANFDALATLAEAGDVSAVTLTDSGTATLSLTTAQIANDTALLKEIAGAYSIIEIAPANGATIEGLSATGGNTVQFAGSASSYTFAASGDGFTVTSASGTDHLTNVQALKFSDATLIVAQTPGSGGVVTTGNVTELYGAVFGREPDIGGLSFYQSYLAAHPNTPLTTFAQWFQASPEYTGNAAHDYAQSSAGDAQFITDSYQNLLGRTPDADEVAFYQKVISPLTQTLTPGTSAYASAQTQAHALVLTYFSQSPEFLGDVQVTAQTPAGSQHFLVLI